MSFYRFIATFLFFSFFLEDKKLKKLTDWLTEWLTDLVTYLLTYLLIYLLSWILQGQTMCIRAVCEKMLFVAKLGIFRIQQKLSKSNQV